MNCFTGIFLFIQVSGPTERMDNGA